MTRRTEIIIAVSVLVLLVLVFLWILLAGRQPAAEPVSQANIPTTTSKPNVPAVASNSVPTTQAVSAATVAKIFIERFGSYSTESNYANIDDILALATTTLQTQLNTIADEARAKLSADTAYYGISTKVISQNLDSSTDTETKLTVMTQREEAVGSPGNTSVKYQNITLDLVKSGDTWLVNSFTWGT